MYRLDAMWHLAFFVNLARKARCFMKRFRLYPLFIDLRKAPDGGHYGVPSDWQISTEWFSMCSLGIELRKEGGVVWLWPWKRSGKGAWYSYAFDDQFDTLYDISMAWEEASAAQYEAEADYCAGNHGECQNCTKCIHKQ